MPDYTLLSEKCNRIKELSGEVIDVSLMYNAMMDDKLAIEFKNRLSSFKHARSGLPGGSTWEMMEQYIMHRIFRQKGLIHKYLHYEELKLYGSEVLDCLRVLADHPWKFSFSIVTGNPADDFYEMFDIFSDETFLLHSPSITEIHKEQDILTWFNLIGYNGECWQTYGPVTSFRAFNADDIFFFVGELKKGILSNEELVHDLENYPVPYMMLAIGSDFPFILQGGQESVLAIGCCLVKDSTDMAELRKNFRVEYVDGVYKFSHEVWSESPYFAEAYWDEDGGKYYVSAQTDMGYFEMAKLLRTAGADVTEDPDIRIHRPMKFVIESLLDRELPLNPYAARFEKNLTPGAARIMEKLDEVFLLSLNDLDAGKEPDYDILGRRVGLSPDYIRNVFQRMREAKNMK